VTNFGFWSTVGVIIYSLVVIVVNGGLATTTGVVTFSAFAFIAIFDAVQIHRGGLENSVSWWIHNQIQKCPYLFGAICFLLGHFVAGMCIK
jgi:uncharacterized membrane protein